MARRVGLPVHVTSAEQPQHARHPEAPVQPLPEGQGGRATGVDVGITDSKPITILVIGDHGGIKDPGPQNAVSNAMQARGGADPRPMCVFTVGDIVYWSPGPDVAVYYRDDGEEIPNPGIIVIGRIDSGVEALDVPGSFRVTIEALGGDL